MSRTKISPARLLAMDLLHEVLTEEATLLDAIEDADDLHVSGRDRALAHEIARGTCRNLGPIRYLLNRLAPRMGDFPDAVRRILELSAYQLLYLDRVPAYAVLSDAVELARHWRCGGLSGAVNGILRNLQRKGGSMGLPLADDGIEDYLSITLSHPRWLVRQWLSERGAEQTQQLCQFNNQRAPLMLRLRMPLNEALQALQEFGIEAKPHGALPNCVVIQPGNHPKDDDFFDHPGWVIQDGAAMLVGFAAGAQPGWRVWDVCAAPGGKTAHLADQMRDEGLLLATDRNEMRMERVCDIAERLELSIVQPNVLDVLSDSIDYVVESGPFDLVLVDAPCTGLGTFRRHPDLRWRLHPNDAQRLGQQALQMLESVAPLVKPGGYLLYSTCTLSAEENRQAAQRFLAQNSGFESDSLRGRIPESFDAAITPEGWLEIDPPTWKLDGMFAARFRKKTS